MLEVRQENIVTYPGVFIEIPDAPDNTLQPDTYLGVVSELRELASHPPKGDPYMGAFYKTSLKYAYQNPQFINLVSDVLAEREITPKHFANLLYRGVQFTELYERQNPTYPNGLNSPKTWEEELDTILQNNSETLRELLLTRHTTSTIYQRYAGARSIMAALLPYNSVRVADFGCGGNYGLPGISLGEPFKQPTDFTEDQRVRQLLQKPLQIEQGLAIDREDPEDPDIKRWRLACSFYPQELGNLHDVLALEERLHQAENIHFLKADLLDLPIGDQSTEVPAYYFDAVIISTLCYQMSPEDQERVLENARNMLNPHGIILVQDFAEKDPENPRGLNFNVNWFGKEFTYRNFVASAVTNWEMKEVLQWKDGRCEQVRKGEDFSLLVPPYSCQPAA